MNAVDIYKTVDGCMGAVARSAAKCRTKFRSRVTVRRLTGKNDGLYRVLAAFKVSPGMRGETGHGLTYTASITLEVSGSASAEDLETKTMILMAEWIGKEGLTRSMSKMARDAGGPRPRKEDA